MAKNPLTINPSNDGKLSLEFSKENFSDFVFSLLATPRQERRLFTGGFDMTLAKIKSIIDKLLHKVQTDHDVLNTEFVADIGFHNDISILLNSYDQFFSMTDLRDETIDKVSITISILMAFNRPPGEKSYEKQTISIIINAGEIGEIETDIRSTEISWPAGYFSLIEQHCKKLETDVKQIHPNFWKSIFFAHTFFTNNTRIKSKAAFLEEKSRIIALLFMTAISIYFITSLTSLIAVTNYPYIFNPESNLVEIIEFNELIKEYGWEKSASLIKNSQILSRLDSVGYADGKHPYSFIGTLTNILSNKISSGIGVGIFIFILCNWCFAASISASRIGRIFLYTETPPRREKGNFLVGILGALIIGASSSIIAAGIVALLT